MKYLTYDTSVGFNIIESDCKDINDARDIDDENIIDYLDDIDSQIVNRIKELLQ